MSDSDTQLLLEINAVVNRTYEVMINHPSPYKRTKELMGEARTLLAGSKAKALKKAGKAYREALGESLVVMRLNEVLGEEHKFVYDEPKTSKLMDKYLEQLANGDYDDAVKTVDKLGELAGKKKIPTFLSVAAVDYKVPEDNPIVSFSVCNLSDKNIVLEMVSIQPAYAHVTEYASSALCVGSSAYFDVKLECPAGTYPISYTLTYTVNLERFTKQGSVSIVVDDEDD